MNIEREDVPCAPAVILDNPKHPSNVGSVTRACACFGIEYLLWTGARFEKRLNGRLPREMRDVEYDFVVRGREDRPFDRFEDVTFVCVELLEGAENILTFEHPHDAVYVFGPEDGSVRQVFRRLCQRFVFIPTNFCLNLGNAVHIVLYDRMLKNE